MSLNDFEWLDDDVFGPKGTCGGSGCGMMHGCPDRKCDETKTDCKECIKDADEAIAQASGPLDLG
jgi:hypothetical protein